MPSSCNTSPADRRRVSASRSRDITVSSGKNRLPGIVSDEIIPQSRILYREILPEKKTTPIARWRRANRNIRPDIQLSNEAKSCSTGSHQRPVMNERKNSWWDLRRYRTKLLTGSLQTIYIKTGVFFLVRRLCSNIFQLSSVRIFSRPKRKSRQKKILICSSGYEAFCVIITVLDVLRLLYSYTP